MIEGLSAVTLGTHNMSRAVQFYRMLGFEIVHGGDNAAFTSFRAGASYLNLIAQPTQRHWSWWGRVIFYEANVDALYDRVVAAGAKRRQCPLWVISGSAIGMAGASASRLKADAASIPSR